MKFYIKIISTEIYQLQMTQIHCQTLYIYKIRIELNIEKLGIKEWVYAPNKIPAQLIHLLADVDGQFGGLYGKDRGSSHYWLAQRNSTPSKGKVANLFWTLSPMYPYVCLWSLVKKRHPTVVPKILSLWKTTLITNTSSKTVINNLRSSY